MVIPPPNKILIIEDEAVNQLILKQILEQHGYEVVATSDGTAGLTLAETFQPALILCDWMMPGLSGLEVCQKLKSQPQHAHIFFVLLTARNRIQDRVEGLDSGADDFLCKPIQPVELLARVRAGLRIFESAQRLKQLTAELQLEQRRLQGELSQAAQYVTSLLPQALSGQVKVHSKFMPSSQLGGDCFDYYWLDEDHLVMYVLDVSGHGLGAALPSVSMQQLLRSQSLPQADFYNPSSVLAALNTCFQMSPDNPRHCTIWYGIYCQSEQTLLHASAGHPPALLVEPCGKMRSIGQIGQLPLGIFPAFDYQADKLAIAPGSILYSFSDGLYEFKDAQGQYWSHAQLSELIQQLHRSGPVELSTLLESIDQIRAIKRFEDDCSVVQVQF